jgi:TFIIF-interacting CTD phosphatase-like protein
MNSKNCKVRRQTRKPESRNTGSNVKMDHTEVMGEVADWTNKSSNREKTLRSFEFHKSSKAD